MKASCRPTWVAITLLGLLATLFGTAAPAAQAIYKGYDANFEAYPFMVSLRYRGLPDRHICGGTLIASDMVLTAAHCLVRDEGPISIPEEIKQTGFVAVVGSNTADWETAPRIPVVGWRVPNGYDITGNNRHDIAVVRLSAPQSIGPVSLLATEPPVKTLVNAVGWGCTDKPLECKTNPQTLQAAHQRVASDSSCGVKVMWNPPLDAETSICTSGSSSINHGDSGGPLLLWDKATATFKQVGVASLGSDNPKKLYGGFTSVPFERAWIDSAMGELRVTESSLVFGRGDYGSREPRDNLATLLTAFGYQVTTADDLPSDLSSFGAVYYVGTDALTSGDIDSLVQFAETGRGLYLTGERPCCEGLNASNTEIANRLVKLTLEGGIAIGGQGDPYYEVGSVPINPEAAGSVATRPYPLTTWRVAAPGGMGNVYGDNVFAYAGTGDSKVPVAAVWDATDINGGGRLAILMDINWLESSYWDENAVPIAANLAVFLSGYASLPAGDSPLETRLASALISNTQTASPSAP